MSNRDTVVNLADLVWRQQGLRCFEAQLPRWLVVQALCHQAELWRASGRLVTGAQLRAFIWGLRGDSSSSRRSRERWFMGSYQWPVEIPGWSLVVCIYSYGPPEFDYVNLSESSFWTAENGFLEDLPWQANDTWLRQMGFDVMADYELDPDELVQESSPRGPQPRHLRLVPTNGLPHD